MYVFLFNFIYSIKKKCKRGKGGGGSGFDELRRLSRMRLNQRVPRLQYQDSFARLQEAAGASGEVRGIGGGCDAAHCLVVDVDPKMEQEEDTQGGYNTLEEMNLYETLPSDVPDPLESYSGGYDHIPARKLNVIVVTPGESNGHDQWSPDKDIHSPTLEFRDDLSLSSNDSSSDSVGVLHRDSSPPEQVQSSLVLIENDVYEESPIEHDGHMNMERDRQILGEGQSELSSQGHSPSDARGENQQNLENEEHVSPDSFLGTSVEEDVYQEAAPVITFSKPDEELITESEGTPASEIGLELNEIVDDAPKTKVILVENDIYQKRSDIVTHPQVVIENELYQTTSDIQNSDCESSCPETLNVEGPSPVFHFDIASNSDLASIEPKCNLSTGKPDSVKAQDMDAHSPEQLSTGVFLIQNDIYELSQDEDEQHDEKIIEADQGTHMLNC